jgi:hypothetical protein
MLTRRRSLVPVVLACAAFLLAVCGDGDDGDEGVASVSGSSGSADVAAENTAEE